MDIIRPIKDRIADNRRVAKNLKRLRRLTSNREYKKTLKYQVKKHNNKKDDSKRVKKN